MAVDIEFQLGKTYPNAYAFMGENPPFSAAVDGIVLGSGRKVIGWNRPYLFIDHHVGDRRAQLASCSHGLEGITLNEFSMFLNGDEFNMKVCANYPDGDVVTLYDLFSNYALYKDDEQRKERVDAYVSAEGRLDRHAAFYRVPLPIWKHILHVLEPLHRLRFENKLHLCSAADCRDIVNCMDDRFREYVLGNGGELEPWGVAEVIDRGESWQLVKETGPLARAQMLEESVRNPRMLLYAIIKGQRDNGNWDYTLYGPKPNSNLQLVVERVTKNEGEGIVTEENAWGGNDNCKGPPRLTGSTICPENLSRILHEMEQELMSPFQWPRA